MNKRLLNRATVLSIVVGLSCVVADKIQHIDRTVYLWVAIGLILSSMLILIALQVYYDWKNI